MIGGVERLPAFAMDSGAGGTAAVILQQKVYEAIEHAKRLALSGKREEAISLLNNIAIREVGARRSALIRRIKVISRIFLTSEAHQAFQEGLNLMNSGKYRQARDRFETSMEKESNNCEVLVRLGQTLVLEGEYDKAAEKLRLAKKTGPFEPQARLWLGRALHQRWESLAAVEELKSVQTDLDGYEPAAVWLAEALLSSGQRVLALKTLEDNIKAQPFHVLSLLVMAKIKMNDPGRENEQLWSARKDLQVALSRFKRYASPALEEFEGDLGLKLRSPAKTKEEILSLLQKIDGRIKSKTDLPAIP